MKKTTFMDTELLVSTIYDHTYMDSTTKRQFPFIKNSVLKKSEPTKNSLKSMGNFSPPII